MAGKTIKVIWPQAFECESYGGMGLATRHLWQFSVGNLLDQWVRKGIAHIHTVHILDHKPGHTEALHGCQEDLVIPSEDLVQDCMRSRSATDRNQIENAAFCRMQVSQASQ